MVARCVALGKTLCELDDTHRSDASVFQIFIVTSQVIRVGVPFSIIWFSQLGGSIGPYFFLRFVDSAFGCVHALSCMVHVMLYSHAPHSPLH